MRISNVLTLGLFFMVNSFVGNAAPNIDKTKNIATVLDDFHKSASEANAIGYFSAFAPEGVFIGTDASERWTVTQFREYAMPFFSKGKGWTYRSVKRNIDLAPSQDVAWFDEILENASYGTCRGSGVLRKIGSDWKISQYHLTIPVPNELADQLVKLIRDAKEKSKR